LPVASILVIEDDPDLAGMLTRLLREQNYAVQVAPDGQRALHLALTRPWDAMVIDRGLPVIDGLDLLTRLRRRGISSPVLILSARGTAAEKVEGLDAGAEDYLAKPFDVDELLARVRALLRRRVEVPAMLPLGSGTLDPAARVVVDGRGRETSLSTRESELLAVLAARPQQVFTRRDLLTRVFTDADSEAVVDTYVYYCRRKLGRDVIRTVHGLGYRCGSL